ncbi:MAG: DUF6318 family protein [Bowdeniella nasicola]|nr:DUF6318 family protein [Bowdeniella nasicola]
MDRLFPVWDKPEPPATLTQPTEQGARDAAVYFTDVFEYVHASRDIAALNAIDQEFCLSCADIREQLARPRRRWGDHSPGQARAVHDTPELDNVFQVEVVGDPVEFVLLGAEADTIAVHRHSAADSMFIVVSYEEGRWVPVALERDEW